MRADKTSEKISELKKKFRRNKNPGKNCGWKNRKKNLVGKGEKRKMFSLDPPSFSRVHLCSCLHRHHSLYPYMGVCSISAINGVKPKVKRATPGFYVSLFLRSLHKIFRASNLHPLGRCWAPCICQVYPPFQYLSICVPYTPQTNHVNQLQFKKD